MTEFDPTLYADIEERDGFRYVTIDPHVMYPAMIERIQYVLHGGIFPGEIIQQRMVDGELEVSTSRTKRLLNYAKSLPEDAWQDALTHRKNFRSPVGYILPNKRPSLDLYTPEFRDDIKRLWNRGDALEVAQGWFLHALRIQIHGWKRGKILTGALEGETRDDFYYYQI